jgi:hypothetical protein
MKRYEESLAKLDIYAKLEEAKRQISAGKAVAAETSMKRLRAKHHV